MKTILMDGIEYYPIKELIIGGVASKSTIYRRVSEGRLVLYYTLSGEPIVKAEDLTKFAKKHSKAS